MHIWFDSLAEPLDLEPQEGLALARWVGRSLRAEPGLPPASLLADRSPRLVFLSVSNGSQPARVALGRGLGILAAVDDALLRILEQPASPTPRWVRLDIAQTACPYEAGCAQGIAFDADSELALLPQEVTAGGLLDREGRLQPERIEECWRRRTGEPWAPGHMPRAPEFSFAIEGFFVEGDRVVPVVEGSRPVSAASPEDLLQAALWAGQYTLRALCEDGRFAYLYDPTRDRLEEGYNLVRHAGAAYVLCELAQETGHLRFRLAAEQAIGYLLQHMRPCRIAGRPGVAITDDGVLNLGGLALSLLALVHFERAGGGCGYRAIREQLTDSILLLQRADGSFVGKSGLEGDQLDSDSAFYPGEAMLALLRLHALAPDDRLLPAVRRGVDYLVGRQRDLPPEELLGNHWLLYCLDAFHRLQPRPEYLDHAMRLAWAMIGTQHRDPMHPGRFGGYGNCYTTTAAARNEGLAAAYRLARDYGRRDDAVGILVALRLGIDFQLRRQYRPEAAMYYPRPGRVLGGFLETPRNPLIRIDGPQHNISSFLALRRIWLPESGAGLDPVTGSPNLRVPGPAPRVPPADVGGGLRPPAP